MDVINNISSLFASEGPPPVGVTQAEVDAFIRINTNPTNGPHNFGIVNGNCSSGPGDWPPVWIMAAMQQMERLSEGPR